HRLERKHGRGCVLVAVRLNQVREELLRQARDVAVQHENVAVEAFELGAARADGVAGAEGVLLDGYAASGERLAGVGRRDNDDGFSADSLGRADHPLNESAAEEWVEVLRHRRAHPRSEPCGHYDSCWLRGGQWMNGWGARIRTWDRGTKTRCLTTWL